MNQQRKRQNNSHEIMKSLNHEIENYSWGVLQDMIEKEVNAAFKIRPQPPCKRWKRKKLGKNEYWTPDSFEKR